MIPETQFLNTLYMKVGGIKIMRGSLLDILSNAKASVEPRYLNGYPFSSANIVCRACDLNLFLTILLSENIHPGSSCGCNEQERCSRVVRCKYSCCKIFCRYECYLYAL